MEGCFNMGKIVNTHGVRGEVKIYPYSDDIKDYLVTLTGSRVVVADEYWDKKNPIYPVSRVFLGYENT